MTVRRALAFSYFEKYVAIALAIASTMVLSRLLSPDEIGVFSVAAVFTGIVGSLRDFGAGTYIVQEPDLTEQRIRSAFGLALILGGAFAAFAAIASLPASWLYRDPGVGSVLLVLSLNFLIVPFGSITQAQLSRDLRYDALAVINLSHATVLAAASIWLAYLGFSYMSPAYGSVAAASVSALVASFFRSRSLPWRPSFAELRRVASFGGRVSGASLLNDLGEGAPDLIIGRSLGLEAAGLFSRANSLFMLYRRAISRAMFPIAFSYLSRENRSGRDVGDALMHVTSLVTGIGWAGLVFMAVYADPIVRVMFGSQWLAAVEPARWLLVAGLFSSLVSFCTPALTAVGDAQRVLRLAVVSLAGRVVAVVVGAPFGLFGIACALAAWELINAAVQIESTVLRLSASRMAWVTVVLRSATLAAWTNALPAALLFLEPFHKVPLLFQLSSGCALAAVGFLMGAYYGRHPIAAEIAKTWRAARTGIRSIRAR